MIFIMLCYVSRTSLIDLKSISIHTINEYQINEDVFLLIKIKRTISVKNDSLWSTSLTIYILIFCCTKFSIQNWPNYITIYFVLNLFLNKL